MKHVSPAERIACKASHPSSDWTGEGILRSEDLLVSKFFISGKESYMACAGGVMGFLLVPSKGSQLLRIGTRPYGDFSLLSHAQYKNPTMVPLKEY